MSYISPFIKVKNIQGRICNVDITKVVMVRETPQNKSELLFIGNTEPLALDLTVDKAMEMVEYKRKEVYSTRDGHDDIVVKLLSEITVNTKCLPNAVELMDRLGKHCK